MSAWKMNTSNENINSLNICENRIFREDYPENEQ